MTKSRNKREGWYQLKIQGEFYRTFRKRQALRYGIKPGSKEWLVDVMNGYLTNDDVKRMYPHTIKAIEFQSLIHKSCEETFKGIKDVA